MQFKKIISSFLTIAIILGCFSSAVDIGVSAAPITTAYIEGTSVRVRVEPRTDATIIEQVSNISATVLDHVTETDTSTGQPVQYTWYQITYFNGSEQITGYVRYDPTYIRIVDPDFEQKISAFPESYRDALRALHGEFLNWNFIPEPVNLYFNSIVYEQSINMRKQVSYNSDPVSWRSMGPGAYDWNTSKWVITNGDPKKGWTGASREIVAYYMDPRNFLNANEIYMFLQQGYNPTHQTEDGVRTIIAGTFMEKPYYDPNDTAFGGDYAKVIMAAAQQSGVSPYIIAAKIRQEIGVSGTSSLISGTYNEEYKSCYNFFNINASGSTQTEVIINGLSYAKSKGWTTRSAAIIGGASWYSNGYITVGQDTYYYQDFNVHNPDKLWHQYAQAVYDARNKGKNLASSYKNQKDFTLNFRIPVFLDMPETAVSKPKSDSTRNNYYFNEMSVTGLTPSFSKFNYNYSLRVTGDTAIKAVPVQGATLVNKEPVALKAGNNVVKVSVKSESGYVTDYVIDVYAEKACTLYVNTTGELPGGVPDKPIIPDEPVVKRGDTNGDGSISVSDMGLMQWYLIDKDKYPLTAMQFKRADVNQDGKISVSDMGLIQWHLIDRDQYPLE